MAAMAAMAMAAMGCYTEVEVVYDDGSDWLLGHVAGLPETAGYFPKDYVVSVEEYEESDECNQWLRGKTCFTNLYILHYTTFFWRAIACQCLSHTSTNYKLRLNIQAISNGIHRTLLNYIYNSYFLHYIYILKLYI
jgi:hypothetical protein